LGTEIQNGEEHILEMDALDIEKDTHMSFKAIE
jgi:hypothetical protein